jgi:hypothetical protein
LLLPSSISVKSCSSFTTTPTRSIASKPLTYPSRLQLVHQTKSHLDLLHLVIWLSAMSYMQWAPSSQVWALQHFQAIFHLHGIVAHTWCTCGLITCVSHIKHILVYLGCHLITKTKLGTF